MSTSDVPSAASFAEQVGAAQIPAVPGGDQPWLARLREEAMARFRETGLPTPKAEAWKYTNLRALEKAGFRPVRSEAPAVGIDRIDWLLEAPIAPHRLVFVEGRLSPAHSRLDTLPDGVTLCSLAEALRENPSLLEAHLGQIADGEDQPMLALNTALMEDGIVLKLARGVVVEEPIEVVFLGGASQEAVAYCPRNLIVLDEASQATLVEQHAGLGDGPYFANGGSEILVGQGAVLRHIKLQAEGDDAFHLATLHARVGRDALYDAFTLSVGGQLSRNESYVRLDGSGASCRLSGAYLMRDQQHCDNTTQIDHLVPHTTCREVFKGVLDGKARAVFQGRIVVHPDAQQTDGHQLSKALLLSDGAEIDAKPELEIYADDVKCSHGATAGELDSDALFYLRSRGIPELEARRVLVQAFLAEALEEIVSDDIRTALLGRIENWLSARNASGGKTP